MQGRSGGGCADTIVKGYELGAICLRAAAGGCWTLGSSIRLLTIGSGAASSGTAAGVRVESGGPDLQQREEARPSDVHPVEVLLTFIVLF